MNGDAFISATALRAALGMDPVNELPVNELPAPFNQSYANLYVLVENFIVTALTGGVDPTVLWDCMSTDIDQIIANHG